MPIPIKYIVFIAICVLCHPVFSAVDIMICEDAEGNQTFEKACSPGTNLVGEKKISVGKNSSGTVDLSKLNVVLYTIPDCETCENVAIYLKSRDIPFSEKDVSKDPKIQQELTKVSGKLSVPVTVIGEEVVSGYDREKIGNILDRIISPE
jgi:glutaredoxin